MRNLALSLILASASSACLAQVEQFTIDVQTNAHAQSSAHSAGDTHDDPISAVARATGDESSDCGEARKSVGVASASVRKEVAYNGMALNLLTDTFANGGHNVTCAGIFFLRSEDYDGSATATATAIVHVVFKQNARALRYRVTIARTVDDPSQTFTLSLRDEKDHELLGTHSDVPYLSIIGGPNKIFTLTSSITAGAQHKGGTGTNQHRATADVRVSIVRAPIIAEELKDNGQALTIQGNKRRIVGGHETKGYLPVGAILINGEIQCTGTLIGPQTVLTAAHCLYTHEKQYQQMEFVEGLSAYKPDTRYQIVGGEYPTGDPPGFAYRDDDLTDDIAVLYLVAKPDGKRFGPYAGMPTLASYQEVGRALTFVGYGYDVVDGEFTGLGIKRQVDLPLTTIDNRQFSYRATAKNTCHGDSGGPAFISDGTALFVAGVTSSGDGGCEEYGISMRIDAYATWVGPRIK